MYSFAVELIKGWYNQPLHRDSGHYAALTRERRRSVTNMSISRATEHLAKLLRDHFLRVDPENLAIRFLEEVARIGEFRDIGNLDAWESTVLNVYSDNEWVKFEQRDDFDVIESVWEVGRLNMYGTIDEDGTRNFYQQTAKKVKNHTGIATLGADSFDFSEW